MGSKVVDLKPKTMPANDQPDDKAVVMATLENILTAQQQQEQQISTLIAVISELQSHVRDLEHEVARLKKNEAKTPVILNAQGKRAN